MQRNAAASVINPLYKSSLFSSHFKLHGISVAPDSPQSYPLIHKCPGFHCHQAPTNVREGHRVLGEGFLKNSEQALQWRGFASRCQKADNTPPRQILKNHISVLLCFPCLPSPLLLSWHIYAKPYRKKIIKGTLAWGFFCLHWSLTHIQKIQYPVKLHMTYARKRVV